MDITFYEVFEEEEAALKKYLPKSIVAGFVKETIQEAPNERLLSEFISVRTQSRLPGSWLGRVKGVLSRSTGYDHLVPIAKKGIVCGYLGSYAAQAVAEHAILAMMVLLRKLKKQMMAFSHFSRDGLLGRQCHGRAILVVGVGNIGYAIVRMAQAMGGHVRGVDIEERHAHVEYISLEDGLRWAEVVFCALPLTGATKNLFNYARLKTLKSGIVFINISRGEISPVQDLKLGLEQGIISGISLDVYPGENSLATALRANNNQLSPEHQMILELSRREDVLFTPHNAFNTREVLAQKAILSVKAAELFLKEGRFPNQI